MWKEELKTKKIDLLVPLEPKSHEPIGRIGLYLTKFLNQHASSGVEQQQHTDPSLAPLTQSTRRIRARTIREMVL